MAYDYEQFQNDIRTLLSTKLGAAITVINNEKNDGLTLAAPAAGDYYLDKYPDHGNPGSPWVVISPDAPVECVSNGPAISQKVTLLIAVGHNAIMNSNAASRKAHEEQIGAIFKRYTRAVQDVLTANFGGIKGRSLLAIETIPMPIPYGEGPNESQLVGLVRLTTSFA